jgi:UPF0176 protein
MYYILAYYFFTRIEEPQEEVRKHKEFFEGRDFKGRIYLSHEGINGTLSAPKELAEEYMKWLKADERFAKIEFKIHTYEEHAFPKMTVKERAQLVALDRPVDAAKSNDHLSADEWDRMLGERKDDLLLLDVRNDYEWEVGHFEGAELPPLDAFRRFPAMAEELKKKYDPNKTKVMMYCTGGIRCELYSVLLKEEGFKNVYQLEGGILKYAQAKGSKHWVGKLFVFDDRLVVPLEEKGGTIGKCTHCGKKCDVYYNCANMDCNELFICCSDCLAGVKGCCSAECQKQPRLRQVQKTAKPFRKLPFEEKKKLRVAILK